MTVTTVPGGRAAAANEVPAAFSEQLVGETLEDMARRDPAKPVPPARVAARKLVAEMAGQGWLDDLMSRAGDGGVALTGDGGFLPEMIKAVLEPALEAELSDQLGYERGDPAGVGSGNARNGSTPKTLVTEVGPIDLDTPRDRQGSFTPRLVPNGTRRLGARARRGPSRRRTRCPRRARAGHASGSAAPWWRRRRRSGTGSGNRGGARARSGPATSTTPM